MPSSRSRFRRCRSVAVSRPTTRATAPRRAIATQVIGAFEGFEAVVVPSGSCGEIEQGALKGKGLEIAWVQDPVALFEVQVQGSGRIHLAEGGTLSIGFDGSNNRAYTAIDR